VTVEDNPQPPAQKRSGPISASTWPMWVLGLVLFVDSTDQSILRGVQVLIKHDFHLSDAAVGFLASAFVFVNALITIPAGYLADRMNRTKVIGGTIVLWSGITALTAACTSYVQLLGVRALLGFGLGITEPSANSLLTDHYPAHQRGRAFSVQQMLLFIGFGLGLGLGGFVGENFGWRWAFIVVGAPGVLVAFVVLRLREPNRGHGDRLSIGIASSLDDPPDHRPPLFEHGFGTFVADLMRGLRDDVKTIAAIPTLRLILVGVGALLFSVTGIGYWLPVYFERFGGLSVEQATAAVGAMVIVGGIPGTLLGGIVADRFAMRIKGGRVAVPAYCLMLGTVVFTISFIPAIPLGLVFVLETIGLIVYTAAIPALRAGAGDAVPAHLRGAGFAASSLIATLSGAALAPPLLGFISDLTNLRVAFVICMPPIFIGALILLRARRHLDDDVAKVLMAVQRAYQEQQALEEQRTAEEANSGVSDTVSPGESS
jgi:MFS family permease